MQSTNFVVAKPSKPIWGADWSLEIRLSLVISTERASFALNITFIYL